MSGHVPDDTGGRIVTVEGLRAGDMVFNGATPIIAKRGIPIFIPHNMKIADAIFILYYIYYYFKYSHLSRIYVIVTVEGLLAGDMVFNGATPIIAKRGIPIFIPHNMKIADAIFILYYIYYYFKYSHLSRIYVICNKLIL